MPELHSSVDRGCSSVGSSDTPGPLDAAYGAFALAEVLQRWALDILTDDERRSIVSTFDRVGAFTELERDFLRAAGYLSPPENDPEDRAALSTSMGGSEHTPTVGG
jgi:hypothetical protein